MAAGTELDYIVSPTDLEEPKDERAAFYGAQELRELKAYIAFLAGGGKLAPSVGAGNQILRVPCANPPIVAADDGVQTFIATETELRIKSSDADPFIFTYRQNVDSGGYDDRVVKLAADVVTQNLPADYDKLKHVMIEYNPTTQVSTPLITSSRPFSGVSYHPDRFWMLDQEILDAAATGTASFNGRFGETYTGVTNYGSIATGFDGKKWLRFTGGNSLEGVEVNADKTKFGSPSYGDSPEWTLGFEFYAESVGTVHNIFSNYFNDPANYLGIWVLINTDNKVKLRVMKFSSSETLELSSTQTIAANTSYHVRMEKVRDKLTMFVNEVAWIVADMRTTQANRIYGSILPPNVKIRFGAGANVSTNVLKGGIRNIYMVPYAFKPSTLLTLRDNMRDGLPQFVHSITGQHMKWKAWGSSGTRCEVEPASVIRIPLGAVVKNGSNDFTKCDIPAGFAAFAPNQEMMRADMSKYPSKPAIFGKRFNFDDKASMQGADIGYWIVRPLIGLKSQNSGYFSLGFPTFFAGGATGHQYFSAFGPQGSTGLDSIELSVYMNSTVNQHFGLLPIRIIGQLY